MTTTVIDALIVTLGLDARGFKQGQADANRDLDKTKKNTKALSEEERKRNEQQNKQHQNQKRQARETSDNYKAMARDAASFFGVIAGAAAIKNWLVELTQSNASMYRLSQNLQTSTETLSGWAGAVEQAGGSSKDAENTMRMLSMSMTEMMVNGTTAILPFLQQMGVSLVDAGNKAKPLDQILLDIAGAMEGKDRNTAFNLGRMMGIDEGTLNLLLKGRREVELMIARQKEIGLVTQQNARESAELSRQWNEMSQRARGLGREIGGELTPILTDVLGRMMDFAKEHPDVTKGALAGLLLLITPLGKIKWLLGGISALLIGDDWSTWQKGGESAIGKLMGQAKQLWYTMHGAFDDKAKTELNIKINDWWKRYLNSLNSVMFGGETTSKVGKKTTKEIRTLMTDEQIISYLMGKGYDKGESYSILKEFEREAGRNKDGMINAKIDFAPKSEASSAPYRKGSGVMMPEPITANTRAAERLAASPQGYNNIPATTTNSNSTTFGQIVIYTQAKDAQGIAAELPRQLANQSESGAF